MSRIRLPDRNHWLRGIPDDDIGHFLGFFGRAPWLIYALCTVSFGYMALVLGGPSGRSFPGVCALVLALVTVALVVAPSRTPLPWWRTAVVVVVVAVVVAVVTWQQPFHDRPPRYDSWELALCDVLLFCLVIRGRYLAAWAGEVLMQGVVCAWSTMVTGSPWYGFSFVYTQAFPLLACSVFAIGMHRIARQIAAHRAAERERAEKETRESANDLEVEAELRIVRDLASPTLQQIATRSAPDPGSVRSLEGALRDLIRGRNLATEPLVTTLRVVRERGADIILLDDLVDDDLSDAERHELAVWAAGRIARSRAKTITLRLTRSHDTLQLTFSADGELGEEYHPRHRTAGRTTP